jgi:hypothetical protein
VTDAKDAPATPPPGKRQQPAPATSQSQRPAEMKVDTVIYDRVKFSQSKRGRVLGIPPRDESRRRKPH